MRCCENWIEDFLQSTWCAHPGCVMPERHCPQTFKLQPRGVAWSMDNGSTKRPSTEANGLSSVH